MNILLVDDEELQLIRLEKSVYSVLPEAKLFSFSNPIKAYEESQKTKMDLAFLDIEMPGLDGIRLAKKLKTVNPLINIVFVTAYDNYALEAYKIHASGYISKPVNKEKILEEIKELNKSSFPISNKKLQVKCFGNFEIFYKGAPVKFTYQKSKEVFAYLIDREGALINLNELNAILWEEDHKSYLRNLITDIQKTLKAIDCDDVFKKIHNGCYIDVNKVDCDAYEYKKDNPDAINLYRGEYMIQYPWAIFEE